MIKIAGLTKSSTGWGIVYFYRGVQITKGAGRFSAPYDFYVGEHTQRNRVLAWNLLEAAQHIDAKFAAIEATTGEAK